MKAFLALAATISVAAASALHNGHAGFHKRDMEGSGWAKPSGGWPKPSVPSYFQEECCKNVVTVTVYGSMAPSPVSTVSKAPVPTPLITTCPTPGVYTFPEVTVTINRTHTVIAHTTTTLTPGSNTWGGYTTSVTAPTTITCPYETKSKSGTVVTSVIATTTYVCPSAGEYTPVPPETTVCETSTVEVYPVPATITPGTYTRKATTVTVTETDYVFVCPFEEATSTLQSTQLVTVTATKQTSAVATVTAVSSPASPVKESSSPAAQSSAPESSAPAYSSPSSAPAPSSSSTSPAIGGNGNKWAISYTPYTSSGQCKTAEEVDVDIALIASKGFTTLRLYATDCSGLQNVGGSCQKHGLKIILGVFISSSGISGAQSQVTDIVNWGKSGGWAIVELIVIGNESIFNGYCSASELAGFISSCKETFSGAGYSGPCTTTEPLNILQASGGALCSVLDVVAGNVQPFFNSGVSAGSAGDFVAGQLELIAAVCPGKTAYNLECGWPSAGSANGAAQPGTQQQKDALTDIMNKAGGKTVFFSFADDTWKSSGTFGVEQHYGCIDLF